ncbi:MAG: PEP-CTERM sorting domain-containing protein [Phycisphaerae bacterium]|jgi:hypothetical protein
MKKWFAATAMVAMLAAPALAATHVFTLDSSPGKSRIMITGTTSTSSPMAGSITLNLGDPSGSFNTRDWDVPMSFETLTARNTQAMSFLIGFALVTVDVDKFGLVDFNQDKGAIPSTVLAGGPNISTGVLATGVKKDILSNLGPDTGWESGFNWNIEVADADHLGVAGTGDLETHVSGTVVRSGVTYELHLYGRTPEPATLSLLGLGGLLGLRRRRR